MPAPVRIGVMSTLSSRRIISSAIVDTSDVDRVLDEGAERARPLGALDDVDRRGGADRRLESGADEPDHVDDQPRQEGDERDAQAGAGQPVAQPLGRQADPGADADHRHGGEDQDGPDEEDDDAPDRAQAGARRAPVRDVARYALVDAVDEAREHPRHQFGDEVGHGQHGHHGERHPRPVRVGCEQPVQHLRRRAVHGRIPTCRRVRRDAAAGTCRGRPSGSSRRRRGRGSR